MSQYAACAVLCFALAAAACTRSSRWEDVAPQQREAVAHGPIERLPPSTPIGATPCGAFGALAFDAAVPLLDGRLRIRPLHGMRDDARGHDVMAADPSDADETRLVLEDQDSKLVIFAYELRASSPRDLVSAARTSLAIHHELAESALVPVSVDAPPLTIAAFAAGPPRRDSTAAPVLLAVVEPPDRHLIGVGVFVTPTLYAPGCAELARKILQTIVVGPRVLEVRARDVTLSGVVRARVPANWAYSVAEGPDFRVHYIEQINALGSPNVASINMYIGDYPQIPPPPTRTIDGRLFGRNVEWGITAPQHYTKAEVIVQLPDERRADVWIIGSNSASINAARAIAERLTLVPTTP